MAQNKIVVTTTPPLPGTTLVAEVNAALRSLATCFAGNVDPASVEGVEPYVVWVDTLTGLVKRRNASNTEWVVEFKLFERHAPRNGDGTENFNLASINGGQLAGFRNLVINGRFKVNQRGAASRTATPNAYNFDRWYYDGTYLYQGIEALSLFDGTFTLSWEGGSTAAYSLNTASSANQGAQSYTAIAKDGQITVSGHTNQTLWLRFSGDLGGLDEVQLEPGQFATPFEHRPYMAEFSLCQRYYQVIRFDRRFYNSNSGSIYDNSTIRIPTMRAAPQVVRISLHNSTGTSGVNISSYENSLIFILNISGNGDIRYHSTESLNAEL